MMEPVARIDAEALKELEKHPEAAATVWSGKARNQFAKGAVALVRLSDAEARIAELEREAVHLKAEISSSDTLIAAVEARAEAAEALLKEAGKALEPLCARADKWSLNSDSARVSVRLGHLRAARAIHDKIGVKDE